MIGKWLGNWMGRWFGWTPSQPTTSPKFITLRSITRYGMAEQFDIEILQGDDFYWEITVLDAAGVPLDLTTYTIRGQGRANYGDVTAAFTFTCTKDTDQTASTGLVAVELSSTSSAATVSGTYKYDIEIVTSGNKVKKLYRGNATVTPEATKA